MSGRDRVGARAMWIVAVAGVWGCAGDVTQPTEQNENEVITTVGLAFTPTTGGAALPFAWSDPENDGSPVIDAITLSDGQDYDVEVTFRNELADPAEDITLEVDEESDQHQVFFTGSAVEGPASAASSAVVTQAYADSDVNGNPVGLLDAFTTVGPGSGELRVVLRHMPPLADGTVVKAAGLAEQVLAEGIDALPGDSDVDVTFTLTVN